MIEMIISTIANVKTKIFINVPQSIFLLLIITIMTKEFPIVPTRNIHRYQSNSQTRKGNSTMIWF